MITNVIDSFPSGFWINTTNVTSQFRVDIASLIITGSSATVSAWSAMILLYLLGENRQNISNLPDISRKFFQCLTIADLMTASGYFMGITRYVIVNYINQSSFIEPHRQCKTDGFCVFQSIVTTFSSMSSFLWTFMITIFLTIKIFSPSREQSTIFIMATGLFHALCWGVPATITLMAFSIGALGDDESQASAGWCWIKDCIDWTSKQRFILMLWTGKMWEILIYATMATFSIIIFVTIKLRKIRADRDFLLNPRDQDDRIILQEENLFLLMPWSLTFFRIWGTIRFAKNSYHSMYANESDQNWVGFDDLLVYMQGIGDSSQAFWNLIWLIYFSERTRQWFRRIICRSRQNDIMPYQ